MAFDVALPLDTAVPDVTPTGINFGPVDPSPDHACARWRCSRAWTSSAGSSRCSAPPNRPPTTGQPDQLARHAASTPNAGLVGQMEGSIAWHSPTTENPALDSTEEWEIWNVTGDAHPVHLHLVNFEILGRQEIVWDSATNEDDRVIDPTGVMARRPATAPTWSPSRWCSTTGYSGNGFRIVNLDLRCRRPAARRVRRERTEGHGHGPARTRSPGSRRPSTSPAATSGTATSCPTRTTR